MKTYLKVMKPVAVTSSMLTACDVPETDYLTWSPATTYGEGSRVLKASKIWESTSAANTNHDPEEDGSTWWVFVSYDNRWKSLDLSTSTQTIQASSMSYTITPGKVVNTVALLNIAANSVRVRVIDPVDGTVYDSTKYLRGVISEASWYSWFFSEVYMQDEVIFDDLPAYGTASVTVDIDAGEGTAAVGVLALGNRQALDFLMLHGVELGILDFSRKDRDDFGEVALVQGNFAETMDIPCVVDTNKVTAARRALRNLRATPCLWMTGSLSTIFGWYNDFSVQVTYESISEASITIEGLI